MVAFEFTPTVRDANGDERKAEVVDEAEGVA